MKAIEIEDLSFVYQGQGQPALDRVDFGQEEGELVVVIGKEGAGRSTLCYSLNRLIPTFKYGRLTGRIRILGEDISSKRVSQMAHQVGLVFQDFESQLFSTNVELEIAFPLENLAIRREDIEGRIKESLSITGLSGFESRDPTTLSGGEKQRLAIASVIATRPKILVMDEPTTDLDPQGREELLSLSSCLRTQGTTLLLVQTEIEGSLDAERIVVISQGRIVKEGHPHEILIDADLLEENGVRPPQIPKLFRGEKGIPLTLEEAAELFQRSNWRIQEERYRSLLQQDKEREAACGEVIIEAEGIDHLYPGAKRALSGVDLKIREGEFVALVGQNGSGKTTLAKHLNGLLKPTEGIVRCFGRNTKEMRVSELARSIGYCMQNPDHQIFSSTVFEEVLFAPKNFGFSKEKAEEAAEKVLQDLDLTKYRQEDPFFLSKGQRQRVATASILAGSPLVLILDEPTTGLDYPETRRLMDLLKKINQEGQTVIVITHSMWIVAEYAHRAVVMKDGQIYLDGPTREVFREEERLREVSLRVPEITALSNRLGKTLLSLDEFEFCLKR